MKTRPILWVILLVAIVGGVAWWLQQTPANPGNPAAATADVEKATSTILKSSTTPAPPASNLSANSTTPPPRAIAAPPAVIAEAPVSNSTIASSNKPAATQPAAAAHTPGLRFIAEPANGTALVLARGRTLFARRRGNPQPVADSASIQVKPPLATYYIGAKDIADGGGLEDVTSSDSYYYAFVADGVGLGAATVRMGENGTTVLSGIGGIGNAPAVAEALDKLPTLDQVNAGSYEPRLLQLQGVFGSGVSSVIWLKSDAPGGDLIYMLPERFLPTVLEAGKLYAPAEFFKLIQPQAQRQMDMYKQLQEGGPRFGGAPGGAPAPQSTKEG